MTIYLPEKITGFRKAFDETCERISSMEQNRLFFALLIKLMECLKKHPLVNNFVKEADDSIVTRKEDFSRLAFETVEDQWRRLWKYHSHLYNSRRDLVIIKRIITGPTEIAFTSTLYDRIQFRLRGFCHSSHLFRFLNVARHLFLSAQFEIQHPCTLRSDFQSTCEMNKTSTTTRIFIPLQLKKNDKRNKLRRYIQFQSPARTTHTLEFKAEDLCLALFSPKNIELDRKFSLQGMNSREKKQNLFYLVETNPSICWERLCFVCDCIQVRGEFPNLSPIRGRWKVIRKQAWESAVARCDKEALLGANMSLRQKMEEGSRESLMDVSIKLEHQIDRKGVEKYLQSLKNHLHNYLFKIENEPQSPPFSSDLELPGTQKANFAIDLAIKYWKENPNGKHDEAFDYYLVHCSFNKQLRRDRWNQIIRELDLDPRRKSEKKRGKGKKTCKD